MAPQIWGTNTAPVRVPCEETLGWLIPIYFKNTFARDPTAAVSLWVCLLCGFLTLRPFAGSYGRAVGVLCVSLWVKPFGALAVPVRTHEEGGFREGIQQQ